MATKESVGLIPSAISDAKEFSAHALTKDGMAISCAPPTCAPQCRMSPEITGTLPRAK